MAINKPQTSGGKGNIGKFIERDPKVCAAGKASAQANDCVANALQHYLLKDEVDSLLNDAIFPFEKPKIHPPPRRTDTRHAGLFSEASQLINPPLKTKFQTLVEDFKNTSYKSYWNKPIGGVRDSVPMLPEGLNTVHITFGKKTDFQDSQYDIILPKIPTVDKTPYSNVRRVKLGSNYCEPPYRKDLTYGQRSFVDKTGSYTKCCLTDDKIVVGTGERILLNTVQSDYLNKNKSKLGKVLAPNNNITQVPEEHSFGKLYPPDNLPECLTCCELNPEHILLKKCSSHFNSLRKVLSTRLLPAFFYDFYLILKYYDYGKSGWLPKEKVYELCGIKHIRFNPILIEPLLTIWQVYDGFKINYKAFVNMIDYRVPLPELPKILDTSDKCHDYRTTYTEMVKPSQESKPQLMAGIPSGRYFDMDYPITPEKCCRADRVFLAHESDVKSCLYPSIFTLVHVNHRDMYAKREPEVVRRVFEAIGEIFTDEKFNTIWVLAAKYHSQGWVCFETFKRALIS